MSHDDESRDLLTRRPDSKYSDTKVKVYDVKPRAFVDYITNIQMSKEEMSEEFEKYITKQESRFQSVIQNIKGLLEKEKTKNRKLNNRQAKLGSATTKSEMLSYFFRSNSRSNSVTTKYKLK